MSVLTFRSSSNSSTRCSSVLKVGILNGMRVYRKPERGWTPIVGNTHCTSPLPKSHLDVLLYHTCSILSDMQLSLSQGISIIYMKSRGLFLAQRTQLADIRNDNRRSRAVIVRDRSVVSTIIDRGHQRPTEGGTDSTRIRHNY